MISGKEKIILLEHSKGHQDSLYAQLLFLIESGYKPVLWINESSAFKEDIVKGDYDIIKYKFATGKERRVFAKELKKFTRKNNVTNIVFNTAQGVRARNIAMRFLFSEINVFGILHEAEKLSSRFTQWTLSLIIKKYFVLNDYIEDYCRSLNVKNIEVKSLYPFFIPYDNIPVINKNENSLLICIPGEVSVDRRNYRFLIESIKQNKKKLHPFLKLVFLGCPVNEKGMDVLEMIKENNLDDIIITYDSYIAEAEYLRIINESDVILPLIDPDVKCFKECSSNKISGAYSLAFSFRKPLLTHVSMKHIEDFRNLSVFYDHNNFIEVLNFLAADKSVLKEKSEKYKEIEKFSFEYQRKNYIRFISKNIAK